MKILKLDHWSVELSDYNLTSVPIRGTDGILADAIYRLKMQELYMEPLENPKTAALNNTEEYIVEVVANKFQTLSTDRLYAEQKKETNCRNLAAQSPCKNRNSFNPVMISTDGPLQKQEYVLGLKHDIIMVPLSVVPTILHEFNSLNGYQGTIHTFEAVRFYWWSKLCKDIKYINKCDICAKKPTKYGQTPTKHLEIPQVLCLATSRGHQWALTATCMHT